MGERKPARLFSPDRCKKTAGDFNAFGDFSLLTDRLKVTMRSPFLDPLSAFLPLFAPFCPPLCLFLCEGGWAGHKLKLISGFAFSTHIFLLMLWYYFSEKVLKLALF